jgi:hypothetical protein
MFLGDIDHRWRSVNHLVRILREQSRETGNERADRCRFEESTRTTSMDLDKGFESSQGGNHNLLLGRDELHDPRSLGLGEEHLEKATGIEVETHPR